MLEGCGRSVGGVKERDVAVVKLGANKRFAYTTNNRFSWIFRTKLSVLLKEKLNWNQNKGLSCIA